MKQKLILHTILLLGSYLFSVTAQATLIEFNQQLPFDGALPANSIYHPAPFSSETSLSRTTSGYGKPIFALSITVSPR